VLHSYQQEFPLTKKQHSGFVDGLKSAAEGNQFNIFIEYLNAKTSAVSYADTELLDSYLQAKYLLNKPDIVYATNDEAILYLHESKLGFLHEVPLVFTGITENICGNKNHVNAGVVEKHSVIRIIATVNLIFKGAPNIVFLASESDVAYNIKHALDEYNDIKSSKQTISIIIERDINKLIEKAKGTAETVYILVDAGGFFTGDRHETLTGALRKLKSELPSNYLFNLHELEIQEGFLGGLVTSGYQQGFAAGKLAAEFLFGMPPNIMELKSESMYVFDEKALDAAGVKLPQDIALIAKMINTYPSFIEKYGKTFIWIIAVLVLVLLVSSMAFSFYIHEQHKLLKEAGRYNQQFMEAVNASNLVSKADQKGRITYINDEYLNALGYTREELTGRNHIVVNHPKMDYELYKSLLKTVTKGNIWLGVLPNITKDGQTLYLETSIVPLFNHKGEITEYLSVRKNITQVIMQQREIREQYTDWLTGLPNRIKMRQDRVHAPAPAVAVINIDSFGMINTFYGMEAGDFILKEFANKLKNMLEPSMTLYRLSGDEFGILDPQVEDFSSFNQFVSKLINRISAEVYHFEGNDLHLTVTSGTSNEKETAITKAGMALRYAKKHKKSLMTFREVSFEIEKIHEAVHYSAYIRKAIENKNVIPHLQAVAESVSGTVVKYEALMRIVDTEGNILPPDSFLYISKQLKLYDALSMIMMEKTLEFLSRSDLNICINFDIEDVLNQRFLSRFEELIRKYRLQGRITIEITESEGTENLDELAAFVTQVKQIGCTIAIDDFGTGYSNFMYILSLQPDYLKIDGSITRQILTSDRAKLLVNTITDLCRQAGIKTVAEYVYSDEIREEIIKSGIDYCQGYLFGKPEPYTSFEAARN
jgi:PAS domain S-box-containing protein/diguanylate cyclase (GGDEF)-like protein